MPPIDRSQDAEARASMLAALPPIAQAVRHALTADRWTSSLEPAVLREAVLAYPSRGGKALRPALLLWSCGALGGDPSVALPAACAVELFHTWTLVHDDIIDADDLRRGLPSAHKLAADLSILQYRLPHARAARFGEHMAILAGDIQQAWANAWLLRLRAEGVPSDVVLAILDRLNSWINPTLISGEANDVAFELRPPDTIGADEIRDMLHAKTAILLGFAAEAGGMIALADPDPDNRAIRALRHFAIDAGLAFQLRDDTLGMFGDAGTLGKPIGSDLRAGKRTWLFALALERLEGADRERLEAALGNPAATPDDVDAVRRLLTACGAAADIERLAAQSIDSALAQLATLPDTPYRRLLHGWAAFMYQRDH